MLLASQNKAEQRMDAADRRMDRLEENIDVTNEVDSWLESLQSQSNERDTERYPLLHAR
jgi:hypothetical protein